jgi:peptidoglycan/LPS O-acetylase OafA/YrhL
LAALLVVAFHCHVTMMQPKYFGQPALPIFAGGFAGVELFFVLSGFVIMFAHHEDRQADPAAIKTFLWKRFVRLYPMLWLVLLPLTVIGHLGIFGSSPRRWDVAAAFFILPVRQEAVLAVEWTLRHEILFYALFTLYLWNRRLGLAVLLLWGGAGSLLFFALEGAPWQVHFLTLPNHMLFLMGMGVAWLHLRGLRQYANITLALGSLGFASAYWLTLQTSVDTHLLTFLFGLGASGIIFGLASLKAPNRASPWLNEAGAASYILYLIHFPLISLALKLAVWLQPRVSLSSELYFLLIILGCQIAALLVHRWIEAPLLSWIRTKGARSASAA